MIAFAQAGLREATGVTTLSVVAASGGPSEWLISYEIPTLGMGLTSVQSLSDSVQQKLSQLEKTNSPEFAAFARGASNADSSLQLQSVMIVSGPTVRNQEVQSNVDSHPKEASEVIPNTANNGILIAVKLVLLGVISGHC